MTDCIGVILAGGQARRMGGGDKGRLVLGGVPLIERVIARLGVQVDVLALNANGDAARFADLGLPVLPDSLTGFPGPLAGVLAGLDWAAEQGAARIVTAAADTPFFPKTLVRDLSAAAGPKGMALAATQAEDGKVWAQPTFGIWPVALREDLRAALGDGLRKVVRWTDRHGAGQVVYDATLGDPFFNINTPEDLVQAEETLCD